MTDTTTDPKADTIAGLHEAAEWLSERPGLPKAHAAIVMLSGHNLADVAAARAAFAPDTGRWVDGYLTFTATFAGGVMVEHRTYGGYIAEKREVIGMVTEWVLRDDDAS